MDYETLWGLVDQHQQTHLLDFWDVLTAVQRDSLREQIMSIDFQRLETASEPIEDLSRMSRPVLVTHVSQAVIRRGRDAIGAGKLAVLIVAGGQGSRLGYEGPKGCYGISPVKNKSLFELFAQKVLSANKEYGLDLDLYIMTSEENHQATTAFWEDHVYFGLPPESVVFFKQFMLPCVDDQGKVLLKDKHTICFAPSGTGATFRALHNACLVERMAQRGIDLVQYVQIDNPLVVIADPAFVGAHQFESAQMSTKVVDKAYPEEKVGLLVRLSGKVRVVEYMHLSEEPKYRRDSDGKLTFRAANLGIHLIERDFIERMAGGEFPFIKAHKKVEHIDRSGKAVKPLMPNAYKFESFVFDALPFAAHTVTMVVDRQDEFAPVKNDSGKDSPDSARELMTAQARRWMHAAGIAESALDMVERAEVSPLFARSQEEFVRKVKPHLALVKKKIAKAVYFC